jgi:hypothetical protein
MSDPDYGKDRDRQSGQDAMISVPANSLDCGFEFIWAAFAR